MGEMRNFIKDCVFPEKSLTMRVRCKKKMPSFGVLKYFFEKNRNNCSIKIRKGWYEPPDDLFDIVMSNSRIITTYLGILIKQSTLLLPFLI
jgi:hypothetical protein